MADLLRKPKGISGNVHHITPANAKGPQSLDWAYVGFALYHLELGEGISKLTGTNEVIVVLVEGKAEINAAGIDFGEMGIVARIGCQVLTQAFATTTDMLNAA